MTLSVVAIVLALLGLLLPFWGFVVVGIAVAVVRGDAVLALLCAGVADLLYGVPVGMFHALVIPFTGCTLLALGIRYLVTRDMRDRMSTTL